ncbi:MAG: hypothetical protein RLZZ200_1805 [Pseudomonadota bacterium]|jgi:beta-glucosidase
MDKGWSIMSVRSSAWLGLAMLPLCAGAQSRDWLDTGIPATQRAQALVGQMTLDEKASQLEDWAPAIPRLGVPDYQTWNEALHGVARAGYATVFPQAIGMAATWDTNQLRNMGDIISAEARAKYNGFQRQGDHRIFHGLTFWSPNINIFRDPRWGRGQETYGEDPYLSGHLGVAFVQGVQGPDPSRPRAIATSKHFAVHSGPEPLRHGFNVDPSARDFEETYLPAFRTTVIEGQVASVMCAYNAVSGSPACASKSLLDDHLRKSWGFKGFVVSDCGAIVDVFQGHKKASDIEQASALSLAAGTDLSCSIWAPGFNSLASAVRHGLVDESLVTRSAERLFAARVSLGMFDPPGTGPLDALQMNDGLLDANRRHALQAAEKSIVLLKNSGVLPLASSPGKIAVIGPTADLLTAILGNYEGTPWKPVTPLEGMQQQFGSKNVVYAQGSTLAEGAAVPVPRTAFGADRGLKAEFFASKDWTGRPVAMTQVPGVQADWRDARPDPAVETADYSVRWSGAISAPAAGRYVFSIEAADSFPYSPVETYRLLIDGKVVSEGSLRAKADIGAMGNFHAGDGASTSAPPMMMFPQVPEFPFDFADTRPHSIVIEYSHAGDRAGGGLTLKWKAPARSQLEEAVARAKEADVVVAFVGLSPQLEGEEMKIKIQGFDGGDRTALDLPAAQEDLIKALAATGKPLIVVLQAGSAVALNWAKEHASAVLAAWYPGVDGGTAIARTLAGLNNPAGRLPVTFYASLEGLPPFTDYSMRGRTYRYFKGKPLWGFGYGLSYSTFKYGPVRLASRTIKAGEPIVATVTVSNTGKVAGDEVVQGYLRTPQADGPIQTLVGFSRVHIEAGASRDVSFTLDPRLLSSVDGKGDRAVLPGRYLLTLGGAQPQETAAKSQGAFTVTGRKPLPR